MESKTLISFRFVGTSSTIRIDSLSNGERSMSTQSVSAGSNTPATLAHLRDSGICSERPGTVLCSDNGTDGPLNHRNLDSSNRFQRDCQIGVLNSEQNLF